MKVIILLTISNVFMTLAWYGHLMKLNTKPLWIAVLVSWGIALIEYCFAVPANRLGYEQFSITQLKTMQEVITLVVFAIISVSLFGEKLAWNHLAGFACLVGAAFFIFGKFN